jgi:Mrp family chromosome partitioning ATPase
MSAKTIGVIQVKGGAGRSTVSTNLAGELSKLGKTVLIDCDMPQGTSASWFAVRQQAGKKAFQATWWPTPPPITGSWSPRSSSTKMPTSSCWTGHHALQS